MGDRFKTTVKDSTVGAVAIGPGARAEWTAASSVGHAQAEYVQSIRAAQLALVHDQDILDGIDGRLYDAIGQFLRIARDIQVSQADLVSNVAAMKASIDGIWAKTIAPDLRGHKLSDALEVIKTLASNPVTVEIARKLLGG